MERFVEDETENQKDIQDEELNSSSSEAVETSSEGSGLSYDREFIDDTELNDPLEEEDPEYFNQGSFLADQVGLPIDVFTRLYIEYFTELVIFCFEVKNRSSSKILENIEKHKLAFSKLFVIAEDTEETTFKEENKLTRQFSTLYSMFLLKLFTMFEKFSEISENLQMFDKFKQELFRLFFDEKTIDFRTLDVDNNSDHVSLMNILKGIDEVEPPEVINDVKYLINYQNLCQMMLDCSTFIATQILRMKTEKTLSEIDLTQTLHLINSSRVLIELGRAWDLEAIIYNSREQFIERYLKEKTLIETEKTDPESKKRNSKIKIIKNQMKNMYSAFLESGELDEYDRYEKYVTIKNETEIVSGKAEKGVFALVDLVPNQSLGTYRGQVFIFAQDRPSDPKEWYDMAEIVNTFGGEEIERSIWVKGSGYFASIINHKWDYPGDPQTMPDELYPYFSNIQMVGNGNLRVLRLIKKDEELFLDYGRSYWKDRTSNGNTLPSWKLKGINTSIIPGFLLSVIADMIECSNIIDGQEEAQEILRLANEYVIEEDVPAHATDEITTRRRPLISLRSVKFKNVNLDIIKAIKEEEKLADEMHRSRGQTSNTLSAVLTGTDIETDLLGNIARYPAVSFSVLTADDRFIGHEGEIERIKVRHALDERAQQAKKENQEKKKQILENFKIQHNILDPDFDEQDMLEELAKIKKKELKNRRRREQRAEDRKIREEVKYQSEQIEFIDHELINTLRKRSEQENEQISELENEEKQAYKNEQALHKKNKSKKKKEKNKQGLGKIKISHEIRAQLGWDEKTATTHKNLRYKLKLYMNRYRVLHETAIRSTPHVEKLFKEELLNEPELAHSVSQFLSIEGRSYILSENTVIYSIFCDILLLYWKCIKKDDWLLGLKRSIPKRLRKIVFKTEIGMIATLKQTINEELHQYYHVLTSDTLRLFINLAKDLLSVIEISWNKANPKFNINVCKVMKLLVSPEECTRQYKKTIPVEEYNVKSVASGIQSQQSTILSPNQKPIEGFPYTPQNDLGESSFLSLPSVLVSSMPQSPLQDFTSEMDYDQLIQQVPPEYAQDETLLQLSPIRISPSSTKYVIEMDSETPITITTQTPKEEQHLQAAEITLEQALATRALYNPAFPVIKSNQNRPNPRSETNNLNKGLAKNLVKPITYQIQKELQALYFDSVQHKILDITLFSLAPGTKKIIGILKELAFFDSTSSFLDFGFGYGGVVSSIFLEEGISDVTAVDWDQERDKNYNLYAISAIKQVAPLFTVKYELLDSPLSSNGQQYTDFGDYSHIFIQPERTQELTEDVLRQLAIKFNSNAKSRYLMCFYPPKHMRSLGFQIDKIKITSDQRVSYTRSTKKIAHRVCYLYKKSQVLQPDPKAILDDTKTASRTGSRTPKKRKFTHKEQDQETIFLTPKSIKTAPEYITMTPRVLFPSERPNTEPFETQDVPYKTISTETSFSKDLQSKPQQSISSSNLGHPLEQLNKIKRSREKMSSPGPTNETEQFDAEIEKYEQLIKNNEENIQKARAIYNTANLELSIKKSIATTIEKLQLSIFESKAKIFQIRLKKIVPEIDIKKKTQDLHSLLSDIESIISTINSNTTSQPFIELKNLVEKNISQLTSQKQQPQVRDNSKATELEKLEKELSELKKEAELQTQLLDTEEFDTGDIIEQLQATLIQIRELEYKIFEKRLTNISNSTVLDPLLKLNGLQTLLKESQNYVTSNSISSDQNPAFFNKYQIFFQNLERAISQVVPKQSNTNQKQQETKSSGIAQPHVVQPIKKEFSDSSFLAANIILKKEKDTQNTQKSKSLLNNLEGMSRLVETINQKISQPISVGLDSMIDSLKNYIFEYFEIKPESIHFMDNDEKIVLSKLEDHMKIIIQIHQIYSNDNDAKERIEEYMTTLKAGIESVKEDLTEQKLLSNKVIDLTTFKEGKQKNTRSVSQKQSKKERKSPFQVLEDLLSTNKFPAEYFSNNLESMKTLKTMIQTRSKLLSFANRTSLNKEKVIKNRKEMIEPFVQWLKCDQAYISQEEKIKFAIVSNFLIDICSKLEERV